MNDEPVIRLQNVSKRFVFTPETPQTLLETLISFFTRRFSSRRDRELWAVKDVNVDVLRGQCLGIIGRNGSGKSTILKLIARILRPSEGRLVVRGRVSALLELGAGFHPDLTGRENIYLNASVLGLTRQDVAACFDDIVHFSELGEFIDMPVKHYSSGMYMRLGFSVAIHVDPDILIVDEILAVGDSAFQKKCIDRIYEMQRNGTTIVIVSHNLNMVRNLSSHMIWLEKGRIKSSGAAEVVAGQYVAHMRGAEGDPSDVAGAASEFERWGSRELEITGVRFLDADGEEAASFKTGESVTVEISYKAHEKVTDAEFGLDIYRQDGMHISRPNSHLAGLRMDIVTGSGVVRYNVTRLPLLPGRYRVTAATYNVRHQTAFDHHELAYTLHVDAGGTQELFGAIEIPATWEWVPERPEGILIEEF